MILVADDAKDARDIMIEGESGLLALYPKSERPRYIPSQAKVEWPHGATAILYSAHDPDSLRGPQGDTAWCDELGKWRYQELAWDNLMFGMRLGPHPQTCATTTPTASPIVKRLIAENKGALAAGREPVTVITGGSTYENLGNLAPAFARQIARYEGTRLGAQELHAVLLEDVEGALWKYVDISRDRVAVDRVPDLRRVVVAVDPAVTATAASNETGIVVVGVARNNARKEDEAYVLADYSGTYTPDGWATEVAEAAVAWRADRVVAEANQGGDLVAANLRGATLRDGRRARLPIKLVHATRGKHIRAEPVAALYERGLVHHAGEFAALEDQMTRWVPGMDSPDRLDALVWGLTSVMGGSAGKFISS